MDRRAVPPARLLRCVQRRHRGHRHLGRASRAPDGSRPSRYSAGRRRIRGRYLQRDDNLGLVSGAARSGPAALRMAGVTLDDIDVVELYDCYTFTVLLTLEDYGFCEKGEGGAFVESGVLGPQRQAEGEHRRRPAVLLLPLGHDPAIRGSDPGPWPGRRAAGRQTTTSCWSAATVGSSTITRLSFSVPDARERHHDHSRHPRDASTAEFFDGTAVGEFRLKRSRATGRDPCPAVPDRLGRRRRPRVDRRVRGTARVVSWAVSYGKPVDGVQVASSVVAIVELAEGPWWWCELLDADPAGCERACR